MWTAERLIREHRDLKLFLINLRKGFPRGTFFRIFCDIKIFAGAIIVFYTPSTTAKLKEV